MWGGVVVYNPDITRFQENVSCILKQVSKLVIYVNSCNEECIKYIKSIEGLKVKVFWGDNSNGLAYALNVIMEEAYNGGAQWVITLDQDSICPDNIVSEYSKKINEKNIAILCPRVIDRRRINLNTDINDRYSFVKRCITSASCTRVSAWNEAGKFDDFLFIDLIDKDFCKRLIIKGWKILRINDLVLNQEFGNITPKKPQTVNFIYNVCTHIKNRNLATSISKLAYKKTVNPIRVYYTNRNVIYLNKKLKNYGGIGYDSYFCKTYLGFTVTFNLASFIRGKEKTKILKAIFNGIKDGLHKARNTEPI